MEKDTICFLVGFFKQIKSYPLNCVTETEYKQIQIKNKQLWKVQKPIHYYNKQTNKKLHIFKDKIGFKNKYESLQM